jgi:electron transport complex protein RnfD
MLKQIISSPFIPSDASVTNVMLTVCFALIPGIAIYIFLFGWGVLTNITVTLVSALIFEWLMLIIRERPIRDFLFDGSAVVTSLLLALTLPPLSPWWLPVIGSFIAIVVAKHLYGGLGYNVFNPAMAAYAVLLISFPLEMSSWSAPISQLAYVPGFIETLRYAFFGILPDTLQIDALSSATLLDHMRTEIGLGNTMADVRHSSVFGYFASAGHEWISIAFLCGGLFLMFKKIISWHIPVSMLAGLIIISTLFYAIDSSRFASPLVHLFSGASILGAFFIATDPVTASTTPLGRIIYGAAIGMLTFVIRAWGGYPDGVAFAVLLIGLTVPLLDQYTLPRVYGARSQYEKH